MDHMPQQASKMARWLIGAVASLLAVGAISAGALALRDDRPSRAVVTAAGDQRGTVDVTSTVTVPLAPPTSSNPTTTLRTTTTLPKAAVDVLKAIAGNTTTTRPTPTTTPAPTTTVATPPTTPSSTTTTAPPQYTATLVNNHPHSFLLIINGRTFPMAPGQTVDSVQLPISPQGDLIQVRLADDMTCGVFDSGVIFQPNARYRITIVVGPGMCGTFPSPLIELIRL